MTDTHADLTLKNCLTGKTIILVSSSVPSAGISWRAGISMDMIVWPAHALTAATFSIRIRFRLRA